MPKTTELTTSQYAKRLGLHRITIIRFVKEKKLHKLPGVVSIKQVGKFFILEVAI